jgi:hypothetical protein
MRGERSATLVRTGFPRNLGAPQPVRDMFLREHWTVYYGFLTRTRSQRCSAENSFPASSSY